MTTTSSEVKALMQAVLKEPGEDSVRLILADALEEEGTEESTDRARLIRVQMELHQIGPPRKTINAEFAFSSGKYKTTASTEDRIKVGDRIDLEAGAFLFKQKCREGLVVRKVEPHDPHAGTVWVTLEADDHSVAYPLQRVGALHSESYALLEKYPDWRPKRKYVGPLEIYHSPRDLPHQLRFVHRHPRWAEGSMWWERGFVSKVRCGWDAWQAIIPDISDLPISTVELITEPEDDEEYRGLYPRITRWILPGEGD